MANALKTLVSKKKNRLIEDGFNLDLTYINDRIIAMGFPSENLESIYRNSMGDVVEFLEKKHKDHYKIYNLCSERSYDISKFHSRVAVYPFDDHNPPEFGQMRPFCEDVSRWLEDHEKNVAVVHCKAGKGRTGLMICAYFLHSGVKTNATDVLNYYASQRTQDSKGVTIPSQRRYVDYYSAMISNSLQYNPVKMYLTSIVIDPLPSLSRTGQQEGYIQFEVRQTSIRPYVSEVYQVRRSDGTVNIELPQPILIVGDVKIEFQHKIKMDILNLAQKPRYIQKDKLFHFWVNTFFIDQQISSVHSHSSTSGSGLAPEPRGTRSHNPSGSTGGAGRDHGQDDSPLPPPRILRHTGGAGGGGHGGSLEDQSNLTSNGSCQASVQTYHHPPAKTVSIMEHYSQVGVMESAECDKTVVTSDSVKQMSSSDDSIIRQSDTDQENLDNGVNNTTHKSFNDMRKRHSSVPQTARTQGPNALQTKVKRKIPGRPMSVRLTKNQIDKASKDKSGKFNENFNVTLFLVRPNDQTLQQEFSRSNNICQRGVESGGVGHEKVDSSDESSEEETAELRSTSGRHALHHPGDSDTASHHSSSAGTEDCSGRTLQCAADSAVSIKTLSAHLPTLHLSEHTSGGTGNRIVSGMVRNHTEPNRMTVSQSTWI